MQVRCFSVPTPSPESDGTLEWEKTVMVFVEIRGGGRKGIGYTYADQSTAVFINDHLKEVITGKNVFNIPSIWEAMRVKVRNLGNPGVSSMAISAIDIALWDLKSRILGLPLVHMLGMTRENIPVYGSGGFTSFSEKEFRDQFNGWLEKGFFMFKMKVGRHPGDDPRRVDFARKIIGGDKELFVDANGAFSVKQAVEYAHRFGEWRVSWFEEPVSSENLRGLNFIRHHSPPAMNITAGEYGYEPGYFRRMLDHDSVDILQIDSTRCGGITGFLKASDISEAYEIPISAHTVPSIHTRLCCTISKAVHVEYFSDHARIEKMFFDGFLEPENGICTPSLQEPGLGLVLKEKDSRKYELS